MPRSLCSHLVRRWKHSGIAAVAAACALAIAAPGATAATPGPATNLERLEAAAAALADSLITGIASSDSLCLSLVPHDAAWLVERAIVDRAASRGVSIRRCESFDPRRVDVAITSLGVLYRETDDGALERVTSMQWSVSAAVAHLGGQLARFEYATENVDTVEATDTTSLATSGYPFTSGIAVAHDSGGFWKRIVEPAVILAASAIVVILLFTVRSQ